MRRSTFEQSIGAMVTTRFKDDATQPRTYAVDLLDWTWARLISNLPVDAAREWLAALQNETPDTRPVAEFKRRTALHCVSLLLGQDGAATYSAAVSAIPPLDVAQSLLVEHQASTIQTIAALLFSRGEKAEADKWRDLRLTYPLFELSATPEFEVLYQTGPFCTREPIADLTRAAVRASVEALEMDSSLLAPIVLALSRHASAAAQPLPGLLRGELPKLNEAVYGAGTQPSIQFTSPRFSLTDEVARITVSAKGSGRFTTGDYGAEPLTSELCGKLAKRLEDRTPLKECFIRGSARIEVTIAKEASITMDDQQLANLHDRIQAALEHLRYADDGIRTVPPVTVQVK